MNGESEEDMYDGYGTNFLNSHTSGSMRQLH